MTYKTEKPTELSNWNSLKIQKLTTVHSKSSCPTLFAIFWVSKGRRRLSPKQVTVQGKIPRTSDEHARDLFLQKLKKKSWKKFGIFFHVFYFFFFVKKNPLMSQNMRGTFCSNFENWWFPTQVRWTCLVFLSKSNFPHFF